MRIRCLLVAALAVGIWGVGWAFAEDDSADSDTAAQTVRAEDVAESSETREERVLIAGAVAESVAATDVSPAVTEATTEPKLDPQTIAECYARASGKCCPQEQPKDWDFECDCCEPESQWRVWGELGASLGSSTNADNDLYDFELNQELEDCDGNRFTFYQRYDLERSYIDANVLTIGAKQHFKNWRANGDLRLREEFKRYDDQNFDSNDRQEGLFDLRWDPKWDCERWNAELSYRYQIKEYETFSPLSYKMHRGRAKIERKVSDTFDWGAHAELVTYNYSFGSDRDNDKLEVGIEAGWHLCDTDINVALEHEEKNFDIRKEQGYEENRLTASLAWKIDCDSRLNARFRANDHERPFEPDRSYDELLLDLTYFRQLACEWALKLRGMGRTKAFGDPTDDMEQRLMEAELTFQPDEEWTWTGSMQRDIYDYANPIRAFTRDRWRLGAQYYHCDLSLGADFEHQVNSYDNDVDRDWVRDTLSFNLGYKHCRHDFRVYAQLGLLDQSDPASVNDYEETQLSATWSYEIDCTTDFILSYEDRERRYDLQPAVRDQVVEARLKFEL